MKTCSEPSRWGTVDAAIKVPSAANPQRTLFSLSKPGVGPNIASRALPTAVTIFLVLISTFSDHSPSFV